MGIDTRAAQTIGSGRRRVPERAWYVIAPMMIAPPSSVAPLGTSPTASQTQIGASASSVDDRSVSSATGTWRAPSVNRASPPPTCTAPMTAQSTRSRG